MKRCSTSLVIREMHIKTIHKKMRHQFTLTRKAIIKKKTDKCWGGCREIRTLIHCSWEYKMMQLLWKMFWQFLKWLIIVYWSLLQGWTLKTSCKVREASHKGLHLLFCIIPFIQNVQNRQMHGDRVDQWVPRTVGGEGGWLLMGMGFLLGGMKMF